MDIQRAFADQPKVAPSWSRRVGDTAECGRRTLALIRDVLVSQKIDFVVFSGDIIDGRGKAHVRDFEEGFAPLVSLLRELDVPWTYLPGNHEGDALRVSRQELLALVRELPGCQLPPHVTSSDHALRIRRKDESGEVHVQVLDAAQRKPPYSLIGGSVDAAVKAAASGAPPHVRLCFTHEALEIFDDPTSELMVGTVTAGKQEPFDDKGLARHAIAGSFDAIFAGHDHHSDYVKQITGGRGRGSGQLWAGHGRCGSFFPPSEHEGKKPLPFARGARVFEVDVRAPRKGVLRTWTVEEGDFAVRNLVEMQRNLSSQLGRGGSGAWHAVPGAMGVGLAVVFFALLLALAWRFNY